MTSTPAGTPERPARIARIITRLNIGGPAIQAAELTKRLAERGCDTLLIHGSLSDGEGDMSYRLADCGPHARIEFVPALQRRVAPVADLRAAAQIARLLGAFQPDIVHTHTAKAGATGRIAALWHRRQARRPVRIVHTYHGHVLEGYFSPAKTSAFIAAERMLARATDRIIAISPRIKTELLEQHRIGRADQYRVVPLGFDLGALAAIGEAERAHARASLDIPAGAMTVTTVGRLTAIKHQRLFLEAARLVKDTHPATLFLIVGDGELRSELETQAAALGLAASVRFLGWRRDLTTVYGATDVFLLTSRNEGTPVALIESLAAGCAGVSTDVGGVRDVLSTPDLDLTAPFDDARALAAHVSNLLADPPRRRRIGELGRHSVLARYGLPRLVDDVEAVYRELLH